MPSFQNSAPGAKSMKFTDALNPFQPFLAQPGDEPAEEDPAPLAQQFDARLRLDASASASSSLARSSGQQHQQQQQQYSYQDRDSTTANAAASDHKNSNPNAKAASSYDAIALKKKKKKQKEIDGDNDISDDENENENEQDSNHSNRDSEDDSDSDDEFDYLLDDDGCGDDGAILQAIRQKRLRELQKTHTRVAEHKAKGHGEIRTISQDEFLSECTSSKHVVVHFFHQEFQKCRVMDHHLKIIATNPKHLSCKFVRIDAEKAPFFVARLRIKTLPTVLVFKNGETIERMLGFEGLLSVSGGSRRAANADADNFPTGRLGYWLESTGAIEYDGPDSDDDDEQDREAINNNNNNNNNGTRRNRTSAYDEEF